MLKLKRVQLLSVCAFFVASLLTSCTQGDGFVESPSNRVKRPVTSDDATSGGTGKKTNKTPSVSTKGTNKTGQKTDSFDEENDESLSANEADACDNPQDDSSLPAYMFSVQDAMNIRPLVETYSEPSDSSQLCPAGQDANASLSRVFEAFTNAAISSHPDLRPGRNFNAFVMSADYENAFNCLQQIGVTEKIIENSNKKTLTAVLCHEMAHSASNAVNKLMDMINKNQGEMQTLESYLQQSANCTGGNCSYRHDQDQINSLKSEIRNYITEKTAISLRMESIADVLGGIICAKSGMTADEYVRGLQEFFERQGGGQLASTQRKQDIPDGATVNIPISSLSMVVEQQLGIYSHPTPRERIDQLKRVQCAIKRQEAKSNIVSDFIRDLGGDNAITLRNYTVEEKPHVVMTLPNGEVVKMPLPDPGL